MNGFTTFLKSLYQTNPRLGICWPLKIWLFQFYEEFYIYSMVLRRSMIAVIGVFVLCSKKYLKLANETNIIKSGNFLKDVWNFSWWIILLDFNNWNLRIMWTNALKKECMKTRVLGYALFAIVFVCAIKVFCFPCKI